MSEIWNFSAGPAVFPAPVLEQIRAELADWQGSGLSVLELSHRGKRYGRIADSAEGALRRLLDVPDDYEVLFLQGGAMLQFAAVPLNLAAGKARAAYVDSGLWAQKAIREAARYLEPVIAWSGAQADYSSLPEAGRLAVPADCAYLHLTSNETVGGVQFKEFPAHGTLVADMSSDILSRPLDVSRFGLIYAGAQKNIGPAGLTVVIVRSDLLGSAEAKTPTVLDYAAQAAERSLLNTPPTFAVYAAGLVLDWLEQLGGVAEIERRSQEKAALLYEAIDGGDFYLNQVKRRDRSLMNVPFRIHDQELEPLFLEEADAQGLLELKGHRSVGGMRASLYNAMPLAGVQALSSFMREFERGKG